MAATVLPDEGKTYWNAWAANANPGDALSIRIAKNNFLIPEASVLADFIEATFPGYAAFTYVRANLSAPVIVANVSEMSLVPPPSFAQSAAPNQTVYSWYLTDDAAGVVLAAAPFDAPITMTAGASLTLTPFRVRLKGF